MLHQKMNDDSLRTRIREQVEFYFGNANLLKDRFMRQRLEADGDHYIDVTVIMKFNRLAALCEDEAVVVAAMRSSAKLEVSADGKRVRRKDALPEHVNVDDRTIYVESLPHGADHDTLRLHFSQFGTVEYVSIPRFKHNRQPKGFAFVEFATADEARAALDSLATLDATPADSSAPTMRAMSKLDWLRLKDTYKRLQRETAQQDKRAQHPQRPQQQPLHSGRIDDVIAEFRHVNGDLSKPDLKAIFETYAPVAFVDHRPGQTMGFVRFESAAGAQAACATFDPLSVVEPRSDPDVPIQLRQLHGDEASAYWERVVEYMAARRDKTVRQKAKHATGAVRIATDPQPKTTTTSPPRAPACSGKQKRKKERAAAQSVAHTHPATTPVSAAGEGRTTEGAEGAQGADVAAPPPARIGSGGMSAKSRKTERAKSGAPRVHVRFDNNSDEETSAISHKRPRQDEGDGDDVGESKRLRVEAIAPPLS